MVLGNNEQGTQKRFWGLEYVKHHLQNGIVEHVTPKIFY